MKIFYFFIYFFLFNQLHIDSNSSKRLIYDKNELYENNINTIYFVDANTNELREKLKNKNISILTYIINDEKYYARNIDVLEEIYLKDETLENKILYDIQGIKVDGIILRCTNKELMELEKLFKIY